jgi:hypothetical protein
VSRILIFFICYVFCLTADISLSSKIPTNIWQTYKTKDLHKPALETRHTWLSLNPEFSCFLYDDLDIERYIQQNWPAEFLDFFRALPIGAMKADLWRYLILASEGGVYTDIDSVCLLPIQEWVLKGDISSPHILFIDVEAGDKFCQWTFAATARHPVMYYICYYILNQWKQRGGIAFSPDGKIDVLGTAGPVIFTDAIKSYVGEPLDIKASKIFKKYSKDKTYRKRFNRLGIFFTSTDFFNGQGSKNLFWGTWANRTAD